MIQDEVFYEQTHKKKIIQAPAHHSLGRSQSVGAPATLAVYVGRTKCFSVKVSGRTPGTMQITLITSRPLTERCWD